MIEYLSQIDSQIFLFFNDGIRSAFLDHVMTLFTGRFIWIPMYAAILVLFIRPQRWLAAVVLTVALAAAIALTDQTCATFIRPLVERLRPSNLENPLSAYTHVVNNYRGGAYGFPSCHAANSFALATFICLVVRRRGFCTFICLWALLNSYSRLYLGVHYPGDLFVGAVIGIIFGAVCYGAASRIIRSRHLVDRSEITEPIFVVPIGINISPVLRLRTIAVRAEDIVIAIGAATAAGIIFVAAI